jgi:hypothetical protein
VSHPLPISSIGGSATPVLDNGSVGDDDNIYAYAAKKKLSGGTSTIPGATFSVVYDGFPVTKAQPGETIQVYAQKETTISLSGLSEVLVADAVISLGTVTANTTTASATALTSTSTIPSPGTDGTPANYPSSWANLSYVYSNIK